MVLPGLDGNGSLRRAYADALQPQLRSILVSYPSNEPLGFAALERIVRGQLPTDQAFVLVAESFSGPLACRVAASRPAGLKALVLCATFAKSPLPALQRFRSLTNLAPIHAVPTAVLSWWLLGRWATADLAAQLRSAITNVDAAVLRKRVCEVLSVDATSVLPSIELPVLGLRASNDRLIRKMVSTQFSSIEGFDEAVIEGPHALLQAAPRACAERTIEFCRAQGILAKVA